MNRMLYLTGICRLLSSIISLQKSVFYEAYAHSSQHTFVIIMSFLNKY